MIRVLFVLSAVAIFGAFSESTGPCQNYRCPRGMVCVVKQHDCPLEDCPEYPTCKVDPDFDACENFTCPDGAMCVANGQFARCTRDPDYVTAPRDVCENFRCYARGHVCVARETRCMGPFGWRNCTVPSCVPDPDTATTTTGPSDACTNYRCPYGSMCEVVSTTCYAPPCPQYARCAKAGDCPAPPTNCYQGRNQCGDDMHCPGAMKCCNDGCVRRCAYASNGGNIGK